MPFRSPRQRKKVMREMRMRGRAPAPFKESQEILDLAESSKFHGTSDKILAAKLYESTMESGQNDQFGSVTEGVGWYWLFTDFEDPNPEHRGHFIVMEDTQGFFDFEQFPTKEAAQKRFEEIRADVEPPEEEE